MALELFSKAIAWLSTTKADVLVTNKYVFALLILFFSVLVGKLFILIIEKIVLVFTSRTKTRLDDMLIEKTRGPLFYILILAGIYFAFSSLKMNGIFVDSMNNLLFSFIIFVFAIAINRISGILIGTIGKKWAEKTESTLDDELLPLFRKVSSVIIFTLALIFILKVWKVDITGLLAGLGIVGIALGFALQDSLKNIFGGVFLILDKNIKLGDVVKLDSGEVGEVVDIGLRSTRIRTPDNEVIIVPNGNLSTSKLQNFVLPDITQRINIKFSVAYGTKVDKAEKTVLEAISRIEWVQKEPATKVVFLEMGESSLNFVCRFWISDYKKGEDSKSLANRLIYEALSKAGIEIPFPARQVYLKKE